MKHLKSFKEEIDLSQYDEVEPGKFVPKGTRYQDNKEYTLTAEQVLDIIQCFSGSPISIEEVERQIEFQISNPISEGKAEKASKNPYGNKVKEDKKDQLRKLVEDHIKNKDARVKKVGDDFEIHYDGTHIGQVMFRDNAVTVKIKKKKNDREIGEKKDKFGKEFKYDELGKIKKEITSIIEDAEGYYVRE